MDGYRITIDMNDVALGDAATLAQEIYDQHGESFDAKLGDFEIRISTLSGDNAYATDWEPDK